VHIVISSLLVALLICVLSLAAFGLFTMTPLAHRIEEEQHRHVG
jgi:hypothetical protein